MYIEVSFFNTKMLFPAIKRRLPCVPGMGKRVMAEERRVLGGTRVEYLWPWKSRGYVAAGRVLAVLEQNVSAVKWRICGSRHV